MRVLVCGPRKYSDEERVFAALNRVHERRGIDIIIEGGSSGADKIAQKWAIAHDIDCLTFPADWATYGRSAGPRRNAQMLLDGKPDGVIAMPAHDERSGTADMCRQAVKAKVRIWYPYGKWAAKETLDMLQSQRTLPTPTRPSPADCP